MPNENQVSIPVVSSFDPVGTDAAAKSLQNLQAAEKAASKPVEAPVSAPGAEAVQAKLHDLAHDADEFLATIKLGAGINVGEKLVEGLTEVIAKTREAIAEGVAYNKEMETLGIGLAAAMKQAEPERFGDFNTALEASGQLLDVVKQKALDLNVSTTGLAHTLQVSMLGLIEGGIKDLNQQVEVTGLLMQAAAAKGVQGFQATRDIIDILNGKAERVVLSKELGLDNEGIKQAKEAGQLAEYLTGKLGAYRDAAAATGQTLAGLEQRFANLKDAIAGEVTSPVFDAIKDGLRDLDAELEKPEVVDGLRAIGFEVEAVVRTGAGLLNFAVQNAGALRLLAEGTAAYGAAMAASKISEFVLSLGAKVLGLRAATAAVASDTTATVEDTAATEANTRAKAENAAASRSQATANGEAAAGKGVAGTGGLGIAGAISAGVLAGTALAAVITEIAAHIDAATARAKALGDEFERGNKALTEQIRQAKTATDQAAARAEVEQRLVDLALRLGSASGQEADFLTQQLGLTKAKLDHFDQLAGTASNEETKQKAITAEEAKQQTILAQIAVQREKLLTAQNEQSRLQAIGTSEVQDGIDAAQANADVAQKNLDTLKAAYVVQGQLVAAAKARATAETGITEALRAAGGELDKQALADASKAEQARAYAAALDEVVRRVAQDTGLREDVVRAIRSGNDAEAAGLSLSKQKQAVLAGYIPNLIEARNAADKANDALQKENAQLASQTDGLKDALGTINDKLTEQRAKLIAAKNSTDPSKSQQIATIESNINALLDDQKKKRQELAALTQKQAEAANPAVVAARDAAQRRLSANQLDPNRDYTPEEEQQRADQNARDQAIVNHANAVVQQDQDIRDGKLPANTPRLPANLPDGGEAVDLADPNRYNADPTGVAAAVLRGLGITAPISAPNPAASTGPASVPYTGPQPPAPQPLDLPPIPQGPTKPVLDENGNNVSVFGDAAANTSKAATDASGAAQKLSDASGKLSDATGGIGTALDNVTTSFDAYHRTNLEGQSKFASGILDRMDDFLTQNAALTSRVTLLQARCVSLQTQIDSLNA